MISLEKLKEKVGGDLSKLGQQERIDGDGFFISYVIAGSGPTGDETALVTDGEYYILNGNWLEEYRPLVKKGLKACKKLFDKEKKEHINFWSS